MKLHQQPFNRNSSRNSSRRNSRCCSCSRDQKQEPAAIAIRMRRNKTSSKQKCRNSIQNWQSRRLHMKLRQQPSSTAEAKQDAAADAAHTPRPERNPKQEPAHTGTNCNLNAQEQDKQHIELQKQHPQMAEQALPHEIASAALNRKSSRKNSRRNSRCCSCTRNRHQNPTQEPAPTATSMRRNKTSST